MCHDDRMRLIDSRETAQLLGVSIRTVQRLALRGELSPADQCESCGALRFHPMAVQQAAARKGSGAAPLSAPDPDALDPLQKEGDASQ